MPRMTPGMTSGHSMATDRNGLPQNLRRSSRKALAVPTVTASAVTQQATRVLVPTLASRSE